MNIIKFATFIKERFVSDIPEFNQKTTVYITKKAATHKEDISIGYVPVTESIKSSTETITLLKRYADDPSIDCIVIHINSSGGNP